MVLERCRVCGGTGAVEKWFGSGMAGKNIPATGANNKTCPACNGTGMVQADRPLMYPLLREQPPGRFTNRITTTGAAVMD
jgi:DnaJ-class molecular chaperone